MKKETEKPKEPAGLVKANALNKTGKHNGTNAGKKPAGQSNANKPYTHDSQDENEY